MKHLKILLAFLIPVALFGVKTPNWSLAKSGLGENVYSLSDTVFAGDSLVSDTFYISGTDTNAMDLLGGGTYSIFAYMSSYTGTPDSTKLYYKLVPENTSGFWSAVDWEYLYSVNTTLDIDSTGISAPIWGYFKIKITNEQAVDTVVVNVDLIKRR